MLGFSQQIAADYGLDLNDLAILSLSILKKAAICVL